MRDSCGTAILRDPAVSVLCELGRLNSPRPVATSALARPVRRRLVVSPRKASIFQLRGREPR